MEDESINYYDDKKHDYEDYWVGRDYEHESEVIAIKKLLKGKHFDKGMDYGGGYGRLSNVLLEFTEQIYLADPSNQQLDIGKKKFDGEDRVKYVLLEKKNVIPSDDKSLDLLVMVRVSHHLDDLSPTFSEINRVLKPGGQAIIEIANYSHFINRVKFAARLKKLPKKPVQIGLVANGIEDRTPFLNHNPGTVIKQLSDNNLSVVRKLSVSNFRKGTIKKAVKLPVLLNMESIVQSKLAPINFGPSIFFLVKKNK